MKNYNPKLHIGCCYKQISVIFFIFFLAACTKPTKEIDPKSESIQAKLAMETFSTGFQQISERYITKISPEELALEGLKGLSKIDPTIQISKIQKNISIKSNKIKERLYPTPTKQDAQGWAQLIVNVIDYSKSESVIFRQTKIARFFEVIFDGSLSHLDSFSRYKNQKKAKKNREKRSGFGGIGINFKHSKNGIIVTQVYTATPAFNAGIKLKDIITHVGKSPLVGLTHNDISNLLRGKIGSVIDISILRSNSNPLILKKYSQLNYSLKRDRIFLPTTFYSVKNGILYIKLGSFNNRTAKDLILNITNGLRQVLVKSKKKPRGLILDLRNNPGGLLKQAVMVSNIFLIDGRITSTRGRHPESNNDYEAFGIDHTKGLPLVVLINGRSASAAEVVAAAIQDHARGIVIGSTSFGKGTIQTVIRLPNDGEVAITWSRFKAPSGYYPHELGISPSICVNGPQEFLASKYIRNILNHRKKFQNKRKAWHRVAINKKLERRKLRATCPATYYENSIDIEIAEELLFNTLLYEKIKAFSSPILLEKN